MWLSSFFPSAHTTSPEDTYQRLPVSDVDVQMHKTTRKPPRFRRRPTLIALASVGSFLAGIGLWLWLFFTGAVGIPEPILHALAKESRLPPLYSRFHQYELQLPQHNLDQASAKTEDVKYFWMANHIQGVPCWHSVLLCISDVYFLKGNGWGNVMQELLLNSYLAYRSGRSYVMNYAVTFDPL